MNPNYPVYIISKGRAKTGQTRKSLTRMNIPYFVAIEEQDWDDYAAEIPEEQLLLLPFSNHGDGPGRARNWCWDHAIKNGHKRHWVMDDNISDFYRLTRNKRIRCESGALFRSCEDFVDRYENVSIAGLQYRFFIAPDQAYPAFVKNTRIYSCLLIENSCQFRWRGRYNEDTDICLRVLKHGDCTVQFNHFLQGKSATQTMAGGNTEEFYHVEGSKDKSKWREGQQNAEGTINKSQMLVDMHPDVASVVWRYGRWHHFVNYLPFKKNKLILKEEYVNMEDKINNYNLSLVKFNKDSAPKTGGTNK